MMKKVFAGVLVASFVAFLPAMSGDIPIFLDESTSMRSVEELVKSEADKVKKEVEKLGYDVKLFKFGESVKPLRSLKNYKADDENTDYVALIEFIQKYDANKPAFLITDGRIPRKLLKNLDMLKKKIKELKDDGNIICILSTMKENTFLDELGFVVKPVGHTKELVDGCIHIWEKINKKIEAGRKRKDSREAKKTKEVLEKEAKSEKKVLILPETKETSLEMIIKVK